MNALIKGFAGAGVALAMSAAAHAQTSEINFGIISTESSKNLATVWDPFLAAMADETGLKVNPFFASDYAGIIEAMRFGKVDVAWYGNKSAMEAVDRANAEVFAQTVDSEGNPGYWSLLITHVDSPLKSLDDVLACNGDLSFGLGDPNSTSGFLVPTTFIFAQRGINPNDCYAAVTNASHEANALTVANQKVDFATNNTENMRRLEVTNPEARAKIKEIWRSPLIPSDPITWRRDLDDETKSSVYRFIMSYGRSGTPEQVAAARVILTDLGWAPFRPSSDAQLYPIRLLENAKSISRVTFDDSLTDAAKAEQIAALEAEKAELEALLASVPQL